ncbi:MAG: transcriptional regulator [Anaerolineales bacterium]|nr:transcriptional regulator [Anaerolineales bacterium]
MDNPEPDFSEISEIDRLIHEPTRLMVMASLYVVASADYTFLMRQAGLTWGNLSAHLSKLEEAGYIQVEKTYRGKRPYTLVRLSDLGRTTFENYVTRMKTILNNLDQP